MKKLLSLVLLILVVVCFSGAGFAQGIGFKGIGGRAGLAKPENVDATYNIAVHANLGEIIENLVIFPSLDYWGSSQKVLGVDVDFSQIAINADVRYYIPTSGNLAFFAGGGLGIFFSSGETASVFGQSASYSNTDIGLNLGGGIDIPINDTLLFTADARFVLSDGNAFKVTGGVTYLLGE